MREVEGGRKRRRTKEEISEGVKRVAISAAAVA
jgi:hypothetical protein